MMKEVGTGEGTRSGCASSEKGVASQTAGGVPGDDGLGSLQMATCWYWLSSLIVRSWLVWLPTAGWVCWNETNQGHVYGHIVPSQQGPHARKDNGSSPLQQGVPVRRGSG